MLTLDGKTYQVPGAYGTIEVINIGSVALPVFNVLLIAGTARQGLPHNASGKKGYEVIQGYSSKVTAESYYGVSELTKALDYAKRGGAGAVFLVNLASLTQAKATIKDNEATPANTLDLEVLDKWWGSAGNDIALTIANDGTNVTYTILPPKLTKYLTADASTSSKLISLEDVEGIIVGATIKMWNNAQSTLQSVTIEAVDKVNKTITISANPSAAYATSAYARIYQEDTDNQETKTFVMADVTIEDVIEWINSGKILKASRSTYTGSVPNTLTKTQLQLISGATIAVSPVATETTGGDFDTFATNAPQLLKNLQTLTVSGLG